MCQVIRVDADAMPTDEPGVKAHEVPLRRCCPEHFRGVDAHPIEDDRQLVHQRNVQITLRVLDHLGGLGNADARRAVHAGQRYSLV